MMTLEMQRRGSDDTAKMLQRGERMGTATRSRGCFKRRSIAVGTGSRSRHTHRVGALIGFGRIRRTEQERRRAQCHERCAAGKETAAIDARRINLPVISIV